MAFTSVASRSLIHSFLPLSAFMEFFTGYKLKGPRLHSSCIRNSFSP
jgi:hypothetical protein